MGDERVPIHFWQRASGGTIHIMRKSGFYGSEKICALIVPDAAPKDVNIRNLANALCEVLESQRPPESRDADET